MNWLGRLFRRRLYNDLSEEMRAHLEEKTEHFMHEGMAREDAERAARRAFGNVALLEERGREVWQWAKLESIWADVKYALRQLRKSPSISFIAILTLALGIGANTAIFTLTWDILLKSLPVPNPGRLVNYEMRNGDNPVSMGLSGFEYQILRQRQKSCVDLLAWVSDRVVVRDGNKSAILPIQLLTANSFRVLELQPMLGRPFEETDEKNSGPGIPAVLSYGYWQREFSGSESAIGRSLVIDGHPVTIVGVMPRTFEGLTANFDPVVYVPMSFGNAPSNTGFGMSPSVFGYFVLGRLKPGATLTSAAAELHALAPSIRKEADPSALYLNQFFKNFRLTVREGRSGISWVKMVYARPLLVLEFLALLLLILCALNTALVMLARVSGRQHEYALRAALGGRRGRLIREVLVETLLLAVPGLAGGVFLGWFGARMLVDMLGTRGSPQQMDLHPNLTILAFNLAATLMVVLGAGLLPAIRAARTAPALDLKAAQQNVASRKLGGWAITLQIAVSLCLVSAAMLFSGSLAQLWNGKSGFQFAGAATAQVDATALKWTKEQNARLAGSLLEVLRAEPGVKAVGYTWELPLSGFRSGSSGMFSIDRKHAIHSNRSLFYLGVSPGYFAAAGTRILSGRAAAGDAPGAPDDCVLSTRLAREFFPGEDPIGQFVYYSTWGKPDGTVLDPKDACRVVAIAEEAKSTSLRSSAPDTVYGLLSPDKLTEGVFGVIVRACNSALALSAVREAAGKVLPPLATIRSQTFAALAANDLNRERMLAGLSGGFAVLAMLLTALGLYGLLMRAVTLRTREIGIRIALGAQHGAVLSAIGRRIVVQVLAGFAAGAVIAVLVGHAARQLLHMFAPFDGVTYLSAIVLLVAVVFVAVLSPMRRAMKVDPMQALRAE